MRRERDRFHDKFDEVTERLEEMRRERDQYRRKFDRAQQESDDTNRSRRTPPGQRRDDDRQRHSPNSWEETSKKDSK